MFFGGAAPAILRSMSRMLEEIRQQPEALARTLSAELRSVEKFKRLVEKRRPRLVVLVARGTSDNAELFGRYLLEITTGIPVSLAAPSITTLYQARVDYRNALVVAISQSGESTDTNLVLERARRQGALTLGITNESGSAMARIAEHVFLVRAGREKSVAATKTYTGQMLMMYLLAYALGGGVRIADLERIPEVVRATLALEPEIDTLSERCWMPNCGVWTISPPRSTWATATRSSPPATSARRASARGAPRTLRRRRLPLKIWASR